MVLKAKIYTIQPCKEMFSSPYLQAKYTTESSPPLTEQWWKLYERDQFSFDCYFATVIISLPIGQQLTTLYSWFQEYVPIV